MSLKDDLQKKHQCLQTAYESLYADYNSSQEQLVKLQDELSTTKTPNIIREDRNIQTEPSTDDKNSTNTNDQTIQTENESEDCKNTLNKITQRVNDILKNCNIEIPEGETIFETIAEKYVEVQWKKDVLERKINEITRELYQTSEVKDGLQMECDELQNTVESLDIELQHVKSNLPSIPEASEERVASLETETESMSQQIKLLQIETETLDNKNSELITAMSNMEGTLRNQENLEAEVRNTKQQLDIARQQLAGASKNVENNENMMEDLRRRLHSSLDENNDLRKRIDSMENRERQMQDELNMYAEKCKSLDENIELIEELKIDINNARKELKSSIENTKRLENELTTADDAKKELERDILALSREKEHLEMELSLIQKNGSMDEDSDLLKNLRHQLDVANHEKDDLEYDIMNMRKELDLALNGVAIFQTKCDDLTAENEKLIQDNNTLLEQLKNSTDEWQERLELVQTEINLLQQEHTFLQEEAAADKLDLSELNVKLQNFVTRNTDLEETLAIVKSECESVKCDYENLRSRAEMANNLQAELQRLQLIEENFQISEAKCKKLDMDLLHLHTELKTQLEVNQCAENKCAEFEEYKLRTVDLTEKLLNSQRELQLTIDNSKELPAMAKETIETLSQIIRQKDEEIQSLKSATSLDIEKSIVEHESALTTLKSERDELVKLVQVKHTESLQYHAEIQRMTQLFNEQALNLQKASVERESFEKLVKDKEAELLWAQNELQVVRQRLKNFEETNNHGEICNIVEHSIQIAQGSILNEKSNALEAALVKEQSSNRILQNQLTDSQQRETAAAKELERLRSHLVEIEANFTDEALLMEHSKQDLQTKLVQTEEKLKNSSTVYTSANIRANQQVETMQQQMALIVQQRDEIQGKLSAAENKVLSHTVSLTNLQIVLEQFQRGTLKGNIH